MRCLLGLALFTLALWGAEDTGWTTYGGNYAGWRYSDLAQIDTENVARLVPKWIFQANVLGKMETTPIERAWLQGFRAGLRENPSPEPNEEQRDRA